MILGTMVPYLRFVFTTLAILNSIGIVTSHDELEHGLAIDCDRKGKETVTFSKVFQLE